MAASTASSACSIMPTVPSARANARLRGEESGRLALALIR